MYKIQISVLLFLFSSVFAYSQNIYTSSDGLISYEVPQGFILSDIPVEYHTFIDPDYKMAYQESDYEVNPSILINLTIVNSSDLRDASFIYHQRDLLSSIYSKVTIESVTNFASENHPDILNVVFLSEENGIKFYNSIFYYFYNVNSLETLMWTMTCTYSYQDKNTYSIIFRNTAKTFSFNKNK